MDSLRDVYKRFKLNYKTESGGINLYPGYDRDLKALLNWIDEELIESDEPLWDCTWHLPYGEDD
jgi:hypothetical protein